MVVAVAGSGLTVPRAGAAEPDAVPGRVPAGGVVRVHVPEAVGGKTVIGGLTVDGAIGAGFVTAYACAAGLPVDTAGVVARSDLNYDGRRTPVASNRLIVKADDAGDVCFYTLLPVAMIVDVNAVTFDTGVTSFANRRTDTRGAPLVPAGGIVRVTVPEAAGGRTVVGQLTVDGARTPGFVTAFACASGLPVDAAGRVARSDLNHPGGAAGASPGVASNRLVVQADAGGDVCLYTLQPLALVVDVNGVADVGITSFPNRRTDTRIGAPASARVPAGGVLRVSVPEAAGRRTVVGQLTVDRATNAGYVTAYGCDDGVPTDASGAIGRSDVNVDGRVAPTASNRLIVQADEQGDVCFYTSQPVALVVDVNAVAGAGISSFPNRRIDTRTGAAGDVGAGVAADGTRTWPPYQPVPALLDVAALTGRAVDPATAARPILAVKIDNYAAARPPWGLEQADAVIELNVEGISRFVALFQSQVPDELGPVRSARTSDFDLLAAMNRPVFAYSGANDGVLRWAGAAAEAGVIVDLAAPSVPACFARSADKPGPHNLLLDPACAYASAATAGPARALWRIAADWIPPTGAAVAADTVFEVPMDGVTVRWRWDAGSGRYQRSQDGETHTTMGGVPIAADTVAVLSVAYVPSVVDGRSPDAATVGVGAAVVHRDGLAVEAVWSRASPYAPFLFFDPRTGTEIPVDVGVTWLELTRAAAA